LAADDPPDASTTKMNDWPQDSVPPESTDRHGVLPLIGERWFLPVVQQLSIGTKRYNQLRRDIPGISMRMLSHTLKHLQRDGLVVKTTLPVVPPHSEYRLTTLGRSLLGPLNTLTDWSREHAADILAHRHRHDEADRPGHASPSAPVPAPRATRRIVRFTSSGVVQQPVLQ
jgi:DNA-binding HxlR family transcriptional regulator